MQTTFMHALRALQRGVVPESEAAWLHAIATNVCHSQRRSTSVRARHTAEVDVQALATQDDAAADGLAAGLNDALAALPERQRTAFFLREWLGLPSREVAEELGLRSNETYALLTRARQSMATALTTSVGRAGLAGHLVPLLSKLKLLLFGGAAKAAATVTVVVAVTAGAGVAVERSTVDEPGSVARPDTPRVPVVPVSRASDVPRADANVPAGQERPVPATSAARELPRTGRAPRPIETTVTIPAGVETPAPRSGPAPEPAAGETRGNTASPTAPETVSSPGSPPVTLPAPLESRLPAIPVRAPAVEVPRVPEAPSPVELPVTVAPPSVDTPQPGEDVLPAASPPGLPLP